MSEYTPIRAIIFDLGDVLQRDSRRAVLVRFEAEWGLRPGQLQTITEDEDLWDEWATGRIDEATFWREALACRGVTVSDPTPLARAVRGALELDRGVLDIIRKLRGQYKVALLTNNSREWMDEALARYPLTNLFDVVVNSADVGIRKPDPRIYRLVCERLGVAPAECLFVDDKVRNTQAAEALGMHVILFESAGQLRERVSGLQRGSGL